MTSDVFDTTTDFASLGLSEHVLAGVTASGFEHPTPIQAQLIPPALKGLDVLGQAKTGTGKTAAFGLPILQQADPEVPMQALILVPTRELAAQVVAELEQLGQGTSIRASCIIGGESMLHQIRSIQRGGHILVGTPGRIMDMQQRGQIHFRNIRFVVLDEVDRMLDIGFREDIRKILGSIKADHQTIFVSATLEDEIERLARRYMKPNLVKIETTGSVLTVSRVDQKYITVEPWDKKAMLLFLLRQEKPDTTLVFCRTKATVHRLTDYLCRKKLMAREIHGDMAQNKRTRVMQEMRDKKLRVLVASDLAARGLDIDHITHVINYDLPEDPDVYVHRIGRTARAGRRGHAWSFVPPDQGDLLTNIEKLTGVMVEQMVVQNFTPGEIPPDIAEIRRREEQAQRQRQAQKDRYTVPAGQDVTAGLSEEQIRQMFPDGKIPDTAPRRGLGSRFRRKSRR